MYRIAPILLAGLLLISSFEKSLAYDESTLFLPFHPDELTAAERQFLQTGLSFTNEYNGLIDGAWGRGSQRALERYAVRNDFRLPTENLLAVFLASQTEVAFEREGWEQRYIPWLDISLLMPGARLARGDQSENFVNWEHESSSLRYSFAVGTDEQASNMQEFTLGRARPGTTPYTLRRVDTLITSVVTAEGGTLYTRSDQRGGHWSIILISGFPSDAGILAAVTGSIAKGDSPPIYLPANGLLARGINSASALAEANAEGESVARKATSERSKAGDDGQVAVAVPEQEQTESPQNFSGTGFLVSGLGHVLTNAHVVTGCREITVDGKSAVVIASDETVDLALLKSDALTGKLAAQFSPNLARLNSDVTVAGFPLNGLLGGLNVTRGSLTSLKGLGGTFWHMQISAPVQPGNSGGPVMDASGAIVGVVVSKLDAQLVADAVGDIPQNVNFAIRAEVARVFLSQNGVEPIISELDLALPPEELADQASAFTYLINCNN
jgi:serine protease Do